MKFTRVNFKVTVTAEDSAVDNIINKIFSGNTQREMPVFTEEAFEEPEAIAEQDIFSEYEESDRVAAYYNAIDVYADEDNVTEPVVVIFGVVNSEQPDNNTTTIKEEKTMKKTVKLPKSIVSLMIDVAVLGTMWPTLTKDEYKFIRNNCTPESDAELLDKYSPLSSYEYRPEREYRFNEHIVENLMLAAGITCVDELIHYFDKDTADNAEQGTTDEQEEVDMTEQAVEYMTVLEAAEQYVAESREAEESGQVEDAAALRRADNSFTITDEHAADLCNWFYRTFKEFVDCDVDTNLLVNLYKMRLRATECTLTFEQYLRRYAYDLLMFNAGIVDETMPCYGDLKFINWLLTDENAYPFIKLYVEAFNTAKVIRPVLSELICIFGGEQSQEQVEQSEEDLLMKLNYDEYTMKMITEARRKQLAS